MTDDQILKSVQQVISGEAKPLTPREHIANLRCINRESCPDWEDLKTICDAVLALYLAQYGGE